jgi:hypothetical protein
LFIYAVGFQGGPQFFHALTVVEPVGICSRHVCYRSPLRSRRSMGFRAGPGNGRGTGCRRPDAVCHHWHSW